MPDDEKLTRDDLLTLLIEECAEVIQAATKCQRFGFEREHEGYGRNDIVLSWEVGDLQGVIDELTQYLCEEAVEIGSQRKIAKALRAKQLYGVK